MIRFIPVILSDQTEQVTLLVTITMTESETGKAYYRVERSYGSFTRTIDLPSKVITDKVEAKEHLGMLETTLPKMERAKTKKITVKAV